MTTEELISGLLMTAGWEDGRKRALNAELVSPSGAVTVKFNDSSVLLKDGWHRSQTACLWRLVKSKSESGVRWKENETIRFTGVQADDATLVVEAAMALEEKVSQEMVDERGS